MNRTRALPRTRRSRQVCLSGRFIRRHRGPSGIPEPGGHRHQGPFARGEHHLHHGSGWSRNLQRQRGWLPDAGGADM